MFTEFFCGAPRQAFVAWAGMAVNAFGLVLLNAVLLVSARKAIISEQPTRLSKSITFLHKEASAGGQARISVCSSASLPPRLS